MRMSSKGQVTIPHDIRLQAGLMPGVDVAVSLSGSGEVRLQRNVVPVPGAAAERGRRMVEALHGAGSFDMSSDDVVRMMRGPSADEELGGSSDDQV